MENFEVSLVAQFGCELHRTPFLFAVELFVDGCMVRDMLLGMGLARHTSEHLEACTARLADDMQLFGVCVAWWCVGMGRHSNHVVRLHYTEEADQYDDVEELVHDERQKHSVETARRCFVQLIR